MAACNCIHVRFGNSPARCACLRRHYCQIFHRALAPTPEAVYQTEASTPETATDDAESSADTSETSGNTAETSGDMININTAPKETLVLLDGIGDKMAQRIITYRTEHGPFETIQDIMKVNGIGDKKFEKIKSRITVN